MVTRVSTGGSKIRIKYDDGTSEVSKFPDKDVIVDDTGNGGHRVSAGRFIPPSQRAAAVPVAEEEPRSREDEEPKKMPATPERKVGRPRKVIREGETVTPKRKVGRPRKVIREEEVATPKRKVGRPRKIRVEEAVKESEPVKEKEHESNEPYPPVKSPKKAKPISPRKRVEDSPHHHEEEHASSADEEEDAHGDSDEKMDDATETEPDADVSDVQNEVSGKRKKLSLKIRLKGPKARIVTSDNREEKDNTSDGDDEHSEEKSNEEDAMSVDQVTSDKNQADGVDTESGAYSTKESQVVEDRGEDAVAEAEKDFETKKRAYDEVSGDEGLVEPPKKKRAEEAPDNSHAEKETGHAAEQGALREVENVNVAKDESDISPKSSDDAEDSAAHLQRKRKRDEEDPQSERANEAPASPTPESADLKTSTMDAEALNPVISTADDLSKEGGNKDHADIAPEPSVSKSTVSKSETAPSKDVSSDKAADQEDADASKSSPRAQVEESAADDSAAKQAAIASIPRFGRRAAQQANERIAARKERIIIDEFAKKKRQRKDKGDGKSVSPSERRKKGGDESGDDEVDGEWVQCDKCSKWRILPTNVQTSDLPKHWYCEMNVYDPERSVCDAPEQTAQEILKEKRRRKRKLAKIARLEAAGKIDAETAALQRLALDNKERKSRNKVRLASRSPNPRDSQDSGLEEGKKRKKRGSPTVEEASDLVDSPVHDTGNDSQKSRSFKKQSSFGSTGRRSNKSEADDMGNPEALVEAEPPVPKKRGRGRPPRAKNKDGGNGDKGKTGKNSANDPDNLVSVDRCVNELQLGNDHCGSSSGIPSSIFQEWVACEKCQKWRRLPSHISANSLPDKWYCSMNTWDPLSATCDAEEDKADPGHHDFGIYGSGVSTASYGNKLSYRNLIFGTGRKQNRPVTERTRAAESLFLAPTDPSSESSYPKVMYANSSVFMPRLSNAQKANAPDVDKKMSLFELMNHSNLWAELRAMPQPDKLGSSIVKSSYDSLSDEMKKTMQDMVLRAIDSGTLASDEVLLETQCRQWTDVPQEWAEARAACTIERIEGAIGDLMAYGRVERVMDPSQTELSAPKYRASTASATSNTTLRPTRCMKIAKPWKKSRPNATHEWCQ